MRGDFTARPFPLWLHFVHELAHVADGLSGTCQPSASLHSALGMGP